jgi:hypothetical protein
LIPKLERSKEMGNSFIRALVGYFIPDHIFLKSTPDHSSIGSYCRAVGCYGKIARQTGDYAGDLIRFYKPLQNRGRPYSFEKFLFHFFDRFILFAPAVHGDLGRLCYS